MKVASKIGAAVLCMTAGAVVAEPVNLTAPSKGTTYFNRPGADMAAHDADLKACILTAQEGIYGPPISTAGGVIPGLIAGGQQNYIRRYNIENCMVVRGWRVVRVEGAVESQWTALRGQALLDKLSSMVGLLSPEGTVVRTWNNDATRPENNMGSMPGSFTGTNLSLQALVPDAAFTVQLAAVRHPETVDWKKALAKPTAIDELDSRPGDSAVIVATVRGKRRTSDTWISFGRMGPDGYTAATNPPGPITVPVGLTKGSVRTPDGRLEETLIAVVPAGRWRVAHRGEMIFFCMGAPYFDLKPGDVVYAGAFDFDKPGLGPDLALDPVRHLLASAAPKTASQIQPASWTNGVVVGCGTSAMYALEFPEAPYAEGYTPPGQAGPR